mgnify:CR=1 FL=1
MKIERDERKFDFHGIGLAIKKAREREGMTQEQLGYIVDRDPRTIMYHENDGQHPSLNAFYQMRRIRLYGGTTATAGGYRCGGGNSGRGMPRGSSPAYAARAPCPRDRTRSR